MAQITYANKVALNENPEIANINKVTDDDMNEIKQVVNDNYNNTIQITNTEPTDSDNKIWIDTSSLSQSDDTNMKYNDNGTYKDIYVKAFDTLPVGTEVDYDGSIVPSGWTDTTDSWHTLNSTIKYKKSGNVVTVTGFSSNTISLSENDYTAVGTLPSGYRPGEQLNNVWNELGVAYSNTIRIGTNGIIQLYSTKNTTYWVFTLTYVIDDKVIRKTSQYMQGGASLSNVYGTSNENGYTQEYINKLETYSTDEIRIGTLINKPIYRKVFQIPETTIPYTSNISSLNIENLVNIYGSLQTGTGSEDDRIPLSTWFSASYNVATTVKIGTGTLNVAWNGWSKLYSGIVVLEYTKTTD